MAKNVDRGYSKRSQEIVTHSSGDILKELDQLRDRRIAKTITEDEYHAESERLWEELRKADRAEKRLKKQQVEDERRLARQQAREERTFDKEKYQLSAARWRLRGLSLATAIRKVEVDREIGHKIADRRSRREWDDDE